MKRIFLTSFLVFLSITIWGQIDKKELYKFDRQHSLSRLDSFLLYELTGKKVSLNFNKNDTIYYPDHSILRTSEAGNGYLNGKLIYYYSNGKISESYKFKESDYCDSSFSNNGEGLKILITIYTDKRNSITTAYYTSGEKKYITKDKFIEDGSNGNNDSLTLRSKLKHIEISKLYYDKNGNEISKEDFAFIEKKDFFEYHQSLPVKNYPNSKEVMPSFPGGESAMIKYISKKIKYPTSERMKGISGTCYVSFVVEKDGRITEVKILQGIKDGPLCNAEAVRVVEKMHKWNPGTLDGKPIRVQFNLPIKFIN